MTKHKKCQLPSSHTKYSFILVKANIFYDNLPVTLAKRSTSAILDCEAYGYPPPTVMWYSSGRELSDTSKYQQHGNGSLEIKHVTEQDAGEYECTASNKLGRKTVTRRLKVKSMYLANALRLNNDQYHYLIKHSDHENERNDHQRKIVLMLKKILLSSTVRNVWRLVRRK